MFKHFGFYKEYYIGDKFIGTIDCDKDREIMGFFGKKIEKSNELTMLKNGKKIKPGISTITFLFPYCGTKTK